MLIMQWFNTSKQWGIISQIFHWGMLLLFIMQYMLAYTMIDTPPSDQKWFLYAWHKQIGLTLFLLAYIRLWWRERNPKPRDPEKMPPWASLFSKINIAILYIIMFSLPITGFLMTVLGGYSINYFGLFTIPSFTDGPSVNSEIFIIAHIWISYLFYVFVGVHILGTLYHYFVLKDNALARMLPHM
ncbi:MAG: cytochrome b [Alphaproteobacteria bacterium]|nr:cytochrome b [Alphaproteobacteria bacterium]